MMHTNSGGCRQRRSNKQLGISVMHQFHSTASKQNIVMDPCFHIILMGREKGIVFPQDNEVLLYRLYVICSQGRTIKPTFTTLYDTRSSAILVSQYIKAYWILPIVFSLLQVPSLTCHELNVTNQHQQLKKQPLSGRVPLSYTRLEE